MMRYAYIYCGDECQDAHSLKEWLHNYEITAHFIKDEDLNNTLDEIMTQTQHTKESKHYSFGAMIFHHVEQAMLSDIIKSLKTLPFNIKRKAVITKNNRTWKICDLLEELDEEHQFYARYQDLKEMLIQNSKRKKEDYTRDSWIPYQYAFMAMYQIYEEKKFNLQELNELIFQFQQTIDQLQPINS